MIPSTDGSTVSTGIEQVFREARGPALATLVRIVGDITVAEDALQDAFVVAVERWPRDGIPPNPGGWIVTTARRRAIDRFRRDTRGRELERLAADSEAQDAGDTVVEEEPLVPDDQLRMVFTCCHPSLSIEHRVTLTLRLIGGLSVADIARAFVISESAVAKRLVRAKHKIAAAKIPYRIPSGPEMPDRLPSVLAVIYLIGTVGSEGPDRKELRGEAIHLARSLAGLMPDEPEVSGLLALLLFGESRMEARFDGGEIVTLQYQDRSLWDGALIAEGQAIVRACVLQDRPGPYQLQAAIQAIHSRAATHSRTDWVSILSLYDRLLAMTPTPIVQLNRSVALAEVAGAGDALASLDGLAVDLDSYHLFHAVRGALLTRLGRPEEARTALRRATELAPSDRERRHLVRGIAAVESSDS